MASHWRGLRGVLSVLVVCAGLRAPAAEAAGGRPVADHPASARDADDVARFLAGLPGRPGSPFVTLESDPAWSEHRQALDATWKEAETERLAGLREFQQKELNTPALRDRVVFYPFGGPDALSATLYFPHSPTYVLIGLEPAGTLPTFRAIGQKNLTTYLGALRESLENEVGHSFFVTREMDREFRGQVTDGLLVPVLELLARANDTILDMRYIRLDADGKIVERAADYHAPGKIGNKGFELRFRSGLDQSVKTLDYLSVNLSDDWLRDNKAFTEYAAGLSGVNTLLKATSYMTHQAGFSMIREIILDRSQRILQDDSGLPYRSFAAGTWKVQLYGEYTQPFGSFRPLEQKDLRKAYELNHPKPLPMPIGYGYRQAPANLLLAERIHP